MGGHWSRSDGTIGPSRGRCRGRRLAVHVRGSVAAACGWSVAVGPGGRRGSFGLLSPTHLSWRLGMAKRRDARDVDKQSCDTDPDVPTGPCAVTRRPACQKPRPESSGAASNRSPPLRCCAPSTSRVSQTNAASLGRAPGDEGIRDSAMGCGLRIVVVLPLNGSALSIRASFGWQRDGSKLWMPSSPWSLG